MKRFKGFVARRNGENSTLSCGAQVAAVESSATEPDTSLQCFPGFLSPAREFPSVRGSASPQCFPGFYAPARESMSALRRRSVDDQKSRYIAQVREREERSSLQGIQTRTAMSSSGSFSSASDFQSSSSRPSDASAISFSSDGFFHEGAHLQTVVVGFDANAREAGVEATIQWVIRNVVQRGDVLVLVGVMHYLRGPLGYRAQVSDQTWLGPNKKFLHDEIGVKNNAWGAISGLRSLCEEAGVRLVVDVKAAARPEIAIVQEANALGAAQVILDKSLNNRRRRYYLESLACDVIRMRRSGGVDAIRSLASIASARDAATRRSFENPPASPTSVIPPPKRRSHSRPPTTPDTDNSRRPPRASIGSSFNSSLSRLVKLVEEKKSSSSFKSLASSCDPLDHDHDHDDDLFTIDHSISHRRIALEAHPDLEDHHRECTLNEGYESDDLFSIGSDGASRRPSFAVFCPVETQSARPSAVSSHDPAMAYFIPPRSSLDSGPRLDKRLTG